MKGFSLSFILSHALATGFLLGRGWSFLIEKLSIVTLSLFDVPQNEAFDLDTLMTTIG